MNAHHRAGPVVEAVGLTKAFGESAARVEALREVDLLAVPGEMVAIIGPSGSGKSTLLHLIGGLEAPTSGRIRVAGHDLTALDDDGLTHLRRRQIGFVFQAFNLIAVLSAEENVALPLIIDGLNEDEAHQRSRQMLARVGLDRRRSHLPAELSGGEQQRVGIARALVTHPAVVLADEPTGNLDTASGENIMAILREVAAEAGRTVLLVTHDPRVAAMADRRIELCDGRVVSAGP